MQSLSLSGLKISRILKSKSVAAAAIGAIILSGCATVDGDTANDPFEDVNRPIFEFNNKLDNTVFEPVAQAYVDNVPEVIRTIVHDTLKFLKTPMIFANNVLQGDIDRAGVTLSRFIVNGIVGFGGATDAASSMGVPYHEEDFGQTLAVWGMNEGPYLMIPVLGPTNIRDGIGTIVDSFLDPLSLEVDKVAINWPRKVASGVDRRADLLDTLDDLERTSLDYYPAIRSLYRQKRNDDINNGEGDSDVPIPNISFDEDEKSDKPAAGDLKPVMGLGDEKPALGAQTSLRSDK